MSVHHRCRPTPKLVEQPMHCCWSLSAPRMPPSTCASQSMSRGCRSMPSAKLSPSSLMWDQQSKSRSCRSVPLSTLSPSSSTRDQQSMSRVADRALRRYSHLRRHRRRRIEVNRNHFEARCGYLRFGGSVADGAIPARAAFDPEPVFDVGSVLSSAGRCPSMIVPRRRGVLATCCSRMSSLRFSK